VCAASAGCAAWRVASRATLFALQGRAVELRPRDPGAAAPDGRPGLLLLALDGVDRALLYALLEAGELPELGALLGAAPGAPPRAHLDRTVLATLPSSTAIAWATIATGVPPAAHGVVGNEFFLRGERRLVAPVPSSVDDPSDVLAAYTGDLMDELLLAPTVYERMRERDPGVRIWVAMHQIHRGADLLLLPDRTAILDGLRVALQEQVRSRILDADAYAVYEELDDDVVDSVCDQLAEEPAPDVLTVYLPGADLYAHVSRQGPDRARRAYLTRALDGRIGALRRALEGRGALANRWVVVTSDHGHTEVVHDDFYSLGVDEEGEPAQVLRRAGYRVRPFTLDVGPLEEEFDAVLAYQGALAYVYLADRSGCLERGRACDWSRPPRRREDVLPAAEAFFRNDRDGLHASELLDALEMVLVRTPGADAEGAPFEVYVGGGRTEPLDRHLRAHPRPNWPRLEARLRELASGPAADRVGDLVLVARAGDEVPLEARRYFSRPYRSHHGSPAAKDSEIPLAVAHPRLDAEATRRIVERALGAEPSQAGIGRLLLALRETSP